jgi:hypothetical protein
MVMRLNDVDKTYLVTAECDVRWTWNHCLLPEIGANDVMVLAREKNLDKKVSVSRYNITDVRAVVP